MKIRELMSVQVASCSPDDSLERAAQIMWEGDLGAVPVQDGEGRLVGMLTDRDICMGAYTQGRRLSETRVSSAMSGDPRCCKPSDSLGFVEELMRTYQVRRLPVVEANRLVGIVTLNDIANAASDARGSKGALEAVGVTIARICERRVHSQAQAAE